MTDPCEDALAKAREAIVYADECFEAALAEGLRDALADNDGERVHDLWSRRLSFARDKFPDALAALSTPPSQSESDDEKLVEAMWREIDRVPATETLRDGIRAALSLARAQWERRSTLPSLPSPPDPDDATLATTKSVLHVAIETLRGQLKNPDSQAIRDALDFYEQEFG